MRWPMRGNAWRREPFLPLLVLAHHVSPCYAYRDQFPGENEEGYAQRLAQEHDDKTQELEAENVATFVDETVVGRNAGAMESVKTYLQRIREGCVRTGVLIILAAGMSGL